VLVKEKENQQVNVPAQAPLHLIIEHAQDITIHKVAASLMKFALMLQRVPDMPCTDVEFWLGGEFQL
jgi:hypothetical protein